MYKAYLRSNTQFCQIPIFVKGSLQLAVGDWSGCGDVVLRRKMNVGIHRSRLVIHLSESQNEMNLHMRSHMLQINTYTDASSRATGLNTDLSFHLFPYFFVCEQRRSLPSQRFRELKYRQIRAAVLFHETSFWVTSVKQYCMPLFLDMYHCVKCTKFETCLIGALLKFKFSKKLTSSS